VTFVMPNSRGSSLPATATQSAYCSSTPQPPSWQRPSYGHELEGAAVDPSPARPHNGPDLDQLRGVAAVEDHSRLATMKWAKRGTREAPTKRRAVAKSRRKELAELYEERLRDKGITVSGEPV
jgi:hypothetical protein